ncbi:bifunctional diguanylate cyclase/phosphodiesterase [Dactylosporangium aurantiacum]|uniref:Bifunctional diguanylate cyclase/phosphodiesterase n=1 Tax=Dactylosporangium aurantiacum TaxID=35754 RepID=A0A9Q9M9U2_9ACTN|nr:bifunctional diguanylate cyclase/phosphodiesterase [Dactylosporangium aurantiacum]MDG6108721.1 bifunctional diguanylate cyclase/phosphodiesterase [Dactylosporangium aurantiacum]UWZ51083.1 bifunctional diguanylate cyclase/phosphodiesterase [Dactylosporangium aurantiacum]
MTGSPPEFPADPPLTADARVSAFAAVWERSLPRTNFIPGGRARRTQILRTLTGQLHAAVTGPVADPHAGFRAGAELVRNCLTDPRVMAASMRVLRQRLLADLGLVGPAPQDRLAELLEQLALGFTTALRDQVRDAAEGIGRDEREAWRAHQQHLQHQVRQALLRDPLTGLPNRAALTTYLGTVIAGKPSARIGVCVLNVQRFAAINDTYGTVTADRLLQDAARRLRSLATARSYYLAHLGGDTFAVVAEDTTGPDDAVKAADAALQLLQRPLRAGGQLVSVTARAGIVERPVRGGRAGDLLRAASMALSWARQDPTTAWALFEPAREALDIRRHQLTHALPDAVHRDELVIEYQPIIRLRDNTVIGMHALPRWNHPTIGPVPAGEFLDLAERVGVLIPLSIQLLRTACARAATWQSGPEAPTLSIDCAVTHLRDPGIVAAVIAALDAGGLPPDRLQLVVAQDALHDPGGDLAFTLDGLARTGISVAVNNTGSPANLAESPVSTVVLDPRLLDGLDVYLPNYLASSTTLAWLIQLFHDLSRTVTAIDVNRRDQLEALNDLGCDSARGDYLAHPMTPEAADRLFSPGPA